MEHLQSAHLTQVAVEIGAAVFIVTMSGSGIGTELVDPAHCVRHCEKDR